jgi:hypothetical protein
VKKAKLREQVLGIVRLRYEIDALTSIGLLGVQTVQVA